MRSLQRVPVGYRACLTLDDAQPQLSTLQVARGDSGLAMLAGGIRDAERDGASPRVLDCVTRDMHAEGALLHVAAGVPRTAWVGAAGRLRIEIGRGDCVEFEIDVRHLGEHRLGVRFLA